MQYQVERDYTNNNIVVILDSTEYCQGLIQMVGSIGISTLEVNFSSLEFLSVRAHRFKATGNGKRSSMQTGNGCQICKTYLPQCTAPHVRHIHGLFLDLQTTFTPHTPGQQKR